MFRFLLFLLPLTLLAGCATPYQQMGLMGGVKAVQIDNDTLRISGRGNGFTDAATIQDYILLRAAQETLARGFGSFEIVDERDVSKRGTYTVPGSATSYTTGSATAYGYGNMATATGSATTNTYYTPPQAIPFFKPGADLLVKMHQGAKPTDAPSSWYDARDVAHYLCASIKCQ